MKLNLKFIFLSLFALGIFKAEAQQIPVLNQYVFNPYLYNPARAGETDFNRISLHHRSQWVEMPDAPITNILTYDMPLRGSNVGIGGMIFSDETHIINNYGAQISYAYHIPFNDDKTHRLSIGVSGGILNQRFDFLKANTETEVDPVLLNETENTVTIDLAAGINYKNGGLNIGFSAPQVLGNSLAYREPTNTENVKLSLERHYLLSASYLHKFGKISLEPVVLGRFVQGLPFRLDGNLVLGYNDMVWIAGGYRSGTDLGTAAGISGSVAVRAKERFTISYTFETPGDSENRSDLGNSHEFGVSYRFGNRNDKELQERLDRIEKNIESIDKNVNDLEDKVDEENEAIKTRVDELEKKLQDGLLGQEELDALKARVTANEEAIKALQKDNAALKAELDATKAKLDQLSRQAKGGGSLYFDQMGSVYFDLGSAVIPEGEKSKLDAIAANIKGQGGSYTVFLSGNASPEGSAESNMALSVRRGNAVKEYLQSVGVNAGKIFILPYGEEVPGEGSTDSGSRNSDRRVDIFITQ